MFHSIVNSLHLPLHHPLCAEIWSEKSYDFRQVTKAERQILLHPKSSWHVLLRSGHKQKVLRFRSSTTLTEFLTRIQKHGTDGYFEELVLVGATCLGTPIYELVCS